MKLIAPAETVKWMTAQGVATASAPLRLPARPELGLLPRVCAPIRCQSLLLGYVWLIDADSSLNDDELRVTADAAERAGLLMYRERLLDELGRGRERELVRDLLGPDDRVRDHAAAELVETDRFRAKSVVLAAVVQVRGGDVDTRDAVELALSVGLDQAARHLPPRGAVSLARLDQGVILLAQRQARGYEPATHTAVRTLHDQLKRSLPSECTATIGLGEPQPGLALARDSQRQALQAVQVAEMVPTFGPVAAWADLGIYRVLASVPRDQVSGDLLHPGLRALLADQKSRHLLHSLEVFLDLAGDVKATSEQLRLHRTSLYYRLSRVEQLADISLGNGSDRLAMHLGLKLARFCQLWSGAENPADLPAERP